MKRFLVLAITVATLAWAAPAKAAETISFNPDGVAGGEPTIEILGLDWSVGNSLLVEDVETIPTVITTSPPSIVVGSQGAGTVYFQANLANAYLVSGTGLFNNGDSGVYYTAVAGYGVTINQVILDGDATSTFHLDLTNPVNFFNIYANTAPASDLTGNCFTCGTLVLTAVAYDSTISGFQGQFVVEDFLTQTPQDLDQANGDNYPGVDTLVGTGSTRIALQVTYRDANYFPTLTIGSTFLTTNTSLINPYDTTDPSGCFDSNGLDNLPLGFGGDCDILGATSVGPVNGRQTRIVTQTDANSSFQVEQLEVVPEPTTLSLLGLGLLLGGAHLRRRAKKKNA
jgi:hypothetical protein